MKDEEILYKAIMKAEKNGYRDHLNYLPLHMSFVNTKAKKQFTKKKFKSLITRIWYSHAEEIIFSHNFAKAFFGDNIGPTIKFKNVDALVTLKSYELALMSMSLEEDRIKYLEKFL
jgi:hypothetical protein